MFGSAVNGFGMRRMLKALRHDTPPPAITATRLGIHAPAAEVFKVGNEHSVGRLALARVFGTALPEGSELSPGPGMACRAGALFGVQGSATTRLKQADVGEVVGIAKAEAVKAGTRLGLNGVPPAARPSRAHRTANFALAIAVKDHKDEVRLSSALGKLIEEDPGLAWETLDATHETLLRGINDEHVALALDRLQRRYGLAVTTRPPAIGLRETVRKGANQRGRHKKQSGGHGQYGDVVIEMRPLPRGEGFVFEDKITGGVIPRQYIPAVEAGIRDAMAKGPLGCPVVDVAVALTDGSFHNVDSSELAFRTAGRMAMSAALDAGSPYLLEPVDHITIAAPGSATSRVTSALATRRGRVLGMAPREGWSRWDTVEAHIPEAELPAFQTDLRSLSQGMATFETGFDHLAEVTGKAAEAMVQQVREMA
jgi:elongation factor G